MNIYVGNLSWSMTDDDLMNLFTEHGTVTSAKILKDKINGIEVQGRKLIVNESQPRAEGDRPKRSFGGGGGGRGGYGGGGGNRGGGGGYGGGGNRGGGGGGYNRDY